MGGRGAATKHRIEKRKKFDNFYADVVEGSKKANQRNGTVADTDAWDVVVEAPNCRNEGFLRRGRDLARLGRCSTVLISRQTYG